MKWWILSAILAIVASWLPTSGIGVSELAFYASAGVCIGQHVIVVVWFCWGLGSTTCRILGILKYGVMWTCCVWGTYVCLRGIDSLHVGYLFWAYLSPALFITMFVASGVVRLVLPLQMLSGPSHQQVTNDSRRDKLTLKTILLITTSIAIVFGVFRILNPTNSYGPAVNTFKLIAATTVLFALISPLCMFAFLSEPTRFGLLVPTAVVATAVGVGTWAIVSHDERRRVRFPLPIF